jgi:acyl carrier protein
LSDDSIPKASLDTVPEWDSLAAVTLVAVIEEEFGVVLPAEDLDQLTSFELILRQLQVQGCPA